MPDAVDTTLDVPADVMLDIDITNVVLDIDTPVEHMLVLVGVPVIDLAVDVDAMVMPRMCHMLQSFM